MTYDNYLIKEFFDLVGRKVEKIGISQTNKYMKIETNDGVFAYDTWGDCCSSTTFTMIIGTKNLIGNIVSGVDTIEYTKAPKKLLSIAPEDSDGSIAPHGVMLKTDKGDCQIWFCNYSNGYYDGGINKIASAEGLKEYIGNDNNRNAIYGKVVWENIVDDWCGLEE